MDLVSILGYTQMNQMKVFNVITAVGLVASLSGCSIYGPAYFGTKHAPTTTIESYYSTKDIPKPFEIVGHMNASTGTSESSQNRTRKLVVEKAKKVGADAVVFSELSRQSHKETTDDFTIKVEVIKFK